ncbi:MAG TPA: hypothetical protein PKD55_01435 [Bellilinea sp.]|nr:hypothetical protein [Bellilinea sp.]
MLEELIETSRRYDMNKHDHTVRARDLEFQSDGTIQVPNSFFGAVQPLESTRWAFGQLASKLGPTVYGKGSTKTLPTDYLMAVDPDLMATNMNRHLSQSEQTYMVRAYGNQARAIVDSKFPTISNTEILEIVDKILEEERINFPDINIIRPYVSADDLNFKIIVRNVSTQTGDYGHGVYVGNGEIGNRRLRVWEAIQRHSCTNSIVRGTDGVSIDQVHRGSASHLRILLKSTLVQALRASGELLDQMLKADEEEIPSFTDVIAGLTKEYGWTDEVHDAILVGTEGRETRGGLIAGVSYAAHRTQEGNDMVDLEILAGKLLSVRGTVFDRLARV